MATWSNAVRSLQRMQKSVAPAAEAGANKMAQRYKEIVKAELSLYPHPPHTRTPSPHGGPPGMISGELRESVLATPAVPAGQGTWIATVSPHTVYAAIQEYGGVMEAHGEYMRWLTDGRWYYKKIVWLPERPYMRPAAFRGSKTGELSRAARDGIAIVLYAAEGF